MKWFHLQLSEYRVHNSLASFCLKLISCFWAVIVDLEAAVSYKGEVSAVDNGINQSIDWSYVSSAGTYFTPLGGARVTLTSEDHDLRSADGGVNTSIETAVAMTLRWVNCEYILNAFYGWRWSEMGGRLARTLPAVQCGVRAGSTASVWAFLVAFNVCWWCWSPRICSSTGIYCTLSIFALMFII